MIESQRENWLEILRAMKRAQRTLATSPSEKKNKILLAVADKLVLHQDKILQTNQNDVALYRQSLHFQKAFEDRLQLSEDRLRGMAQSLKEVALFPDPVGREFEKYTLPNHLILRRVHSPLGVLFVIFEARPNVIAEAFALALKSGNALLLKGGKESNQTCQVIYELIEEALRENEMDPAVFKGLVTSAREATDFLIKQKKFIDVIIPRGGSALIDYISENSSIPIIKNDRGLCHIYVHAEADEEMALALLDNAKTQRPSVCNAVETLLVDKAIAPGFLKKALQRLSPKGVEFFGCERTLQVLHGEKNLAPVRSDSYDTEYLDLKLSVRIVENIEEAIEHIRQHGSAHSEAIVTANERVARVFQNEVDAAAVYWNASTRFTDGGQLGLGAEIGISTQKLHVRGPVGLLSLTSLRWLIDGQGQTRN